MRILILEDEPSMATLLEQIVEHLWPHAEVSLAHTAESALEHWRERRFDLALLDWELPGASGIEVLKCIKESARKTICVMVSAHADRHSILAAGAHHVDAFIVKPFNIEEVKTRLLQVMAAARRASQPESADGVEDYGSIDEFIAHHFIHGTLGLPIAPELVNAIKGMQQLDMEEMKHLLQRCQHDPALVLRVLSLANSHAYLHGAAPLETFGCALRRIGLGGLVHLTSEMSRLPGSALKSDWLRAKHQAYQNDSLDLAGIVTRLSADVEFDADAMRTACLLSRSGELSLLALMQAWMDLGHRLDAAQGEAILARDSVQAGYKVKRQWSLPQAVCTRTEAAFQLPVGTVRKDQILMRIAGLVHEGDAHQALPRLLARLGLPADAAEHYRTSDASPS